MKKTLFMLSSVDGKISTGDSDDRDIDKDFHSLVGVREGVQKYYDLEQKTDLCSFNTGRVMAKMGVNDKKVFNLDFMTFIIVDNSHLTDFGVTSLSKGLKQLFIITKNKNHPALNLDLDNLEVIFYEDKIDFKNLFEKLENKYKIENITIQSGGTMNSILLRENLIDEVSLVVAPVFVGGKNTSTLIDGESLISEDDLKNLKALELLSCEKIDNSFLHLKYKVIKNTEII
jgi:2,5-diamino-6-(ribosylamino)-4(3H)-pyrimidinone 5'-phosphate reductase